MEAKSASHDQSGTNGAASGKAAFAEEIRDQIAQENEDMSEADIDKEIDKRWAELPDEKKQEYANRDAGAKAGKRKNAAESKEAKASKPKKAKKSGRGPNSFMVFANEIRPTIMAENPGISIGESGKLIGARWRALSEAEKEVYKQKALRIKEGRDDDEN